MPRPALEVVALFTEPDNDGPAPAAQFPHARPCPPAQAAACHKSASGFALRLGPEELRAAAAAGRAFVLRCDTATATPAWLASALAFIGRSHALGTLAIVLPAARRAVGRRRWRRSFALADDAAQLNCWSATAVQEGALLCTHTRGMGYVGLPQLVCRTLPTDAGFAARLLEGCIVHLMDGGAGALPPGSLHEVLGPDGRLFGRSVSSGGPRRSPSAATGTTRARAMTPWTAAPC